METKEAIMAFSQSEKIKAGLIWVSQILEHLRGVPDGERKVAERFTGALLGMIGHEVGLAKAVAGGPGWDEVTDYIDKADVMVHSGVGHEALSHISQALSRVTTIGQKSMTSLKDRGLL